MRRDLKFAIRYLTRNIPVTAAAVLSLALGMMATTAIYSVVHAVVLDPFPYKRHRQPDERQGVERQVNPAGAPGTPPISSWRSPSAPAFSRASSPRPSVTSCGPTVRSHSGSEATTGRRTHSRSWACRRSSDEPTVRRMCRPGAPPVVVLGYRFWQRQFGGDHAIVGRNLRLNGQTRTVVGVMPKRFMWRGADVYLPIALRRGEVVEGVRNVHLLGRLKPHVSEAAAAADLGPIIADLKRREPAQFPDNWRVSLLSFEETFPSSIRQNLWIMFGAVGLLLLISCANVSNLLLSKAVVRQKEMTMRAALGSGRGGDHSSTPYREPADCVRRRTHRDRPGRCGTAGDPVARAAEYDSGRGRDHVEHAGPAVHAARVGGNQHHFRTRPRASYDVAGHRLLAPGDRPQRHGRPHAGVLPSDARGRRGRAVADAARRGGPDDSDRPGDAAGRCRRSGPIAC